MELGRKTHIWTLWHLPVPQGLEPGRCVGDPQQEDVRQVGVAVEDKGLEAREAGGHGGRVCLADQEGSGHEGLPGDGSFTVHIVCADLTVLFQSIVHFQSTLEEKAVNLKKLEKKFWSFK